MRRRKPAESSWRELPSARSRRFPDTSWGLVERCRNGTDDDRKAAREQLVLLYWKPVYRFYQRALGIRGDRLEDLTQAFFARFLEKDFLRNLREHVSFRGFLKTACRRFLVNYTESQKRHEGVSRLDSDSREAPFDDARIDREIDAEFRRYYIEEALELTRMDLEKKGKEASFLVLRERTLGEGEPPSYDAIAAKLGLTLIDVRHRLSEARRVFRRMIVRLARERSDAPEDELAELGLRPSHDLD